MVSLGFDHFYFGRKRFCAAIFFVLEVSLARYTDAFFGRFLAWFRCVVALLSLREIPRGSSPASSEEYIYHCTCVDLRPCYWWHVGDLRIQS